MKLNQIEIIETIKQECSDYISTTRNNTKLLYRGMSLDSSTPVRKMIRQDRQSRNVGEEETNFYNLIFESLHHVEMIRSVCAYTSNNAEIAGGYGRVYAVMPINGSHYIANPKVIDTMAVCEQGLQEAMDMVVDLSGPQPARMFHNALGKSKTLKDLGKYRGYLDTIIHKAQTTDDLHYVTKLVETQMFEDYSEIPSTRSPTEICILAPYYYAVPITMIKQIIG